ncbi:MAG: septum site-determining protein MinD [Bacillota bacterium]|nr:MAG: septum site-determining protein MinD [Bacillota bacterium]
MARKIVITSGKGGVGKTTVAANLGMNLSLMGARVALVDVDFGLNNLDVVMNVENKVVYDITDVLEGRCRVKQALVQADGHKNLYVLPSDSMKTASSMTGQSLKVVTENLAPLFDYLLLDCPAGVDAGFHRAVSCADEAILVSTPCFSCLRDADKVVSILKSYRLEKVSLVANRVRGDLVAVEKTLSPKDMESLLKIPLIGVLPDEDDVMLYGTGFSQASRIGKAFRILARNVEENTRRIYDATARYTGFFGQIKRGLRRSV